MYVILLSLFVLAIGLSAWADTHGILLLPKRLVYVLKILLTAIVSFLTGGGILWFLGLNLLAQAIDKSTRAWIAQVTPEDKTSWWSKIVINRFGDIWAKRLIWIEFIVPLIISVL